MAEATTAGGAPNALDGINRLPAWRQMALLAALAGSIALGVWIALWSQTPNYSLLFNSLSGSDAGQVMEALDKAAIPYQLDPGSGAVMVPTAKVHEARMKLAQTGLPKGSDLGFELLGKKQAFGTSQFLERARFQRALEVELARTISALANVDSARVHLAVPRQSTFLKARGQASGSVLVKLAPGRRLEPGQPGAIAHLVAAAIPGLDTSRVRVVDDKGQLLTAGDDAEALGLSRRQLDFARRVEGRHVKRIEAILAPIVGPNGVKAQVVAELDFTRTERSRESFNPDLPSLRSEQVEEVSNAASRAGGVPGALSNQPPGDGQSPETGGTDEGGSVSTNSFANGGNRRRATRNFELDRTVSHTLTPSGQVRRLSVAVVVDDCRATGGDGAVTQSPRTPEEMARFERLVKDAIGFDAERGDTVNVTNAGFTPPEVFEPLPEPPLWKQPWVGDLAKQAGGLALVLLIAFGVLRPMARSLVAKEASERRAEQAIAAAKLPPPDADRAQDALPASTSTDQQIDVIRQLVQQDPKRVANVMRNWVSEDG